MAISALQFVIVTGNSSINTALYTLQCNNTCMIAILPGIQYNYHVHGEALQRHIM